MKVGVLSTVAAMMLVACGSTTGPTDASADAPITGDAKSAASASAYAITRWCVSSS